MSYANWPGIGKCARPYWMMNDGAKDPWHALYQELSVRSASLHEHGTLVLSSWRILVYKHVRIALGPVGLCPLRQHKEGLGCRG